MHCSDVVREMGHYLWIKLMENQFCLKALEWKLGTTIESFLLPTLATSSLFFIKTLTQWAKHIDRIKKKVWGEKIKIKGRQMKKKSATCHCCSCRYFSFQVQLVVQILWYSIVFKLWLDQRCQAPTGRRSGFSSIWLVRRFSSKTWHHRYDVDSPGVELDGSDGVMRSLQANKQYCPYCPVKGNQADWVHERAVGIAFHINWFTKGKNRG